MTGQTTGTDEWNDPYQIVASDPETGVMDEQRRAIRKAVVAGYEDQHTTIWLDAHASFLLEDLTPIDDDPVTECEFRVRRFVHGTPADRHTGSAQLTNDGWEVTYETRPWGQGLLDSVRSFLPATSPD